MHDFDIKFNTFPGVLSQDPRGGRQATPSLTFPRSRPCFLTLNIFDALPLDTGA